MAQIFSFMSAQTQPSPFYEVAWPGTGRAEPAPERGRPRGAPAPLRGCSSQSVPVHGAAWEAGARDQLQRQQQQPLLFHTSVFLALLCISVQELKLRSLAEVLSVVTALRAVVRHSLACSLSLSPFFFPFFSKFAARICFLPVDTWCSCQGKGPRVGSRVQNVVRALLRGSFLQILSVFFHSFSLLLSGLEQSKLMLQDEVLAHPSCPKGSKKLCWVTATQLLGTAKRGARASPTQRMPDGAQQMQCSPVLFFSKILASVPVV